MDKKAALKALSVVLGFCIAPFYVLVVIGCVDDSPGLPNIFLAAFRQRNAVNDFEIRVAYYGICARQNNKLACFGTPRTTTATSSHIAREISDSFDSTSSMDMLIPLAFALQSKFQHTFAAGGAAYVVGVFFCGLLYVAHKVFHWPKVAQFSGNAIIASLWLALMLALPAALLVTQTEDVLQLAMSKMVGSPVQATRGVAMEVFHWLIFGCLTALTLAATALRFMGGIPAASSEKPKSKTGTKSTTSTKSATSTKSTTGKKSTTGTKSTEGTKSKSATAVSSSLRAK